MIFPGFVPCLLFGGVVQPWGFFSYCGAIFWHSESEHTESLALGGEPQNYITPLQSRALWPVLMYHTTTWPARTPQKVVGPTNQTQGGPQFLLDGCAFTRALRGSDRKLPFDSRKISSVNSRSRMENLPCSCLLVEHSVRRSVYSLEVGPGNISSHLPSRLQIRQKSGHCEENGAVDDYALSND